MELIKSDVTVVGGGIAGICAAIAAARNGLKVALVNDRPVLGGNASSEVRVHINGSAYLGNSPSYYAREGGLVEELKLKVFHYNPLYNKKLMFSVSDTVLLDMVYGEPNISLFLNTCVYETGMESGRIGWVDGLQLASERKFKFESPYFIDCSGDGVVGYQAGARYKRGREARNEFDEDLAPDTADRYTMGDTILFQTRDLGYKVPFRRPEFAYDITKLSFFENLRKGLNHRVFPRKVSGLGGLWWLEYGGHLDVIKNNEEIALELRKLVYGIWDYIKNSGEFDDVDNLILDYVCPIPGKRESRRFIGDYMLSQNDLTAKPHFEDAVAVGGWAMDLHAAKGIYDEGPATAWNFVPGLYNLPFRSLYSANVPNLMMAGRNISATHVAFGSTRVMATCGCMGQAVGTAAALCVKYGADPSSVAAGHMAELQSMLLRDGQTIVGLKEELNPCLADGLTVRASSQRKYENEANGVPVPLDRGLCLALPVCTDRVNRVSLKVRNETRQTEMLHVKLMGGEREENYIPSRELKSYSLAIESGHDGWIALDLDQERPADDKVYIVLECNTGLSVYCNDEKLTGAVSFHYRPEEPARLKRWDKNICFKELLPAQNMYDPGNVINGHSRPYGLPNVWVSALSRSDGKGSPEWLELAFDRPKDLEEFHLVFNGRLDLEHFDDPIETLIKDYDAILTFADGSERTVEVRGNYLSLNKHKVAARGLTRIRFEFGATYGSPYYEVFAVKLYAPDGMG
ncbi:FAD-dependent oxidoreductase [Paenibacillus sp. LHD-117]|uniref:FAD-dependent oxidoreductase n=1 Tax=Paenibacillus sp. LHD-117 TaxID=3071412 RepID=UPI0027E09224|nr:FAD-dependent oxidoreductase [Paenibacillus sp. LHD-117]MDQ6418436.1 FAD-dependent oxidoreductase [Paenibacillus sp. LHD-117]